MNKYNFDTVMTRYQNSIPSCYTLRARYAKYREYYDQMVGPNGVIDKLRQNVTELLGIYQTIRINVANIKPAILEYYNSVSQDKKVQFSSLKNQFDCSNNYIV